MIFCLQVSVMLRISQSTNVEQTDSFIEVDQRRKQVSILQPKNLDVVPQRLQSVNTGPKLFAFDAIFEQEMCEVSKVIHFDYNSCQGM